MHEIGSNIPGTTPDAQTRARARAGRVITTHLPDVPEAIIDRILEGLEAAGVLSAPPALDVTRAYPFTPPPKEGP